MKQLETIVRNTGQLNMVAWVVLGILPALLLLWGHKILNPTGDLFDPDCDVLGYLLLIPAAAIPLIGLLVSRRESAKYLKGTSASKTPWHLYLSIGVFQMFLIYVVYLIAFLASFRAGAFSCMVYFYTIALVWSAICWPRKRAYEKLQNRIGTPHPNVKGPRL